MKRSKRRSRKHALPAAANRPACGASRCGKISCLLVNHGVRSGDREPTCVYLKGTGHDARNRSGIPAFLIAESRSLAWKPPPNPSARLANEGVAASLSHFGNPPARRRSCLNLLQQLQLAGSVHVHRSRVTPHGTCRVIGFYSHCPDSPPTLPKRDISQRRLAVGASATTIEKQIMTLGTILLVLLILMVLGALPTWPHSRSWGYAPSGGLGLILIIILVLFLLGRI